MEFDQIYQDDSLELMQSIDFKSIDLICTDPPYIRSLVDLYQWEISFSDFAESFDRILSDKGQIAIFGDFLTSVEIANAFKPFFKFRYFYTWIKSNGQPVNKKQPRSNVELITIWKKKKTLTRDLVFNPIMRPGDPYRKKTRAINPTRKKSLEYETINTTGDRFPNQTILFPSKCNLTLDERATAKPFPCYKSVALIGYLIKTLSNENDLVLDPFSGSGSVAIVCQRLNRRFICIEKDSEFFIKSLEWLENEKCKITLPL